MERTTRKLLTIVVEAALERRIVEEFEHAGIKGFTVVNARGDGERGRRGGDWDEGKSLRIETICDEETAVSLAEALLSRWGKDYALVLWLQDVEVFRGGKFEPAK